MRDILKIPELKQRFGNLNYFTVLDIRTFYSSCGFAISDEAFRSRIYRLRKMGVLQQIGRGVYRIGEQVIFIPTITPTTKRIFTAIHKQFPYVNKSIWHTSTLNEFMLHQPFKFNLIIEVEKDAVESVFHYVKEKFNNVYLNPNAEIYQNYISGKTDSVIVKSMITESPVQKIYNVTTPTIEKILVDIYSDKIIYSAFQGNEMNNIFKRAVNKYTVNSSTLLRYALRRGKREEIVAYMARLGIGVKNKNA